MTSNREKIKALKAEIEKTRRIIDSLNKKSDELLAESGYDGE